MYVSERVIASEPNRRLQFSVRAAEPDKQPTSRSERDDITQTYLLSDDTHTSLSIVHGDFGKIPKGQDVVPQAAAIWDRVLPKIKELAERRP